MVVSVSLLDSTGDTRNDIFLSYARDDQARAQSVFDALGRQGWSVFMDAEIPNATRWQRHLEAQLEQVACVLVLWSKTANARPWVRREAAEGKKRGVLVHATIDGTKPPEGFAQFQFNDLSTWDGGTDHVEYSRVLRAVAMKVGPRGETGAPAEPAAYEDINEAHIALASTSWRRKDEHAAGPFPHQIHLRLVGSETALQRVESVLYYFDPAYAANRPEHVDPVLKAYVEIRLDWRTGFSVYEVANGYSVVRAEVKVKGQGKIVRLSRLVDIMNAGPRLKDLYPIRAEVEQ